LQNLTKDHLVVWEQGESDLIWVASVDSDETVISGVIGKVTAVKKIADLKILEISTEEIIRNIYVEGAVRHG
jgi:ABC-2 type transport system ATP-binding protein